MNSSITKQRIDRILANLGYCSRRDAAGFIREHRISVNGKQVLDGAEKADAHQVQIGQCPLDHPDGLFLLLNKPAGYICSHDESEGRLIYELLPQQWMRRNPVPATIGRLDKDTTGAILITDQTVINHQMTSPRKAIEKVYQVVVDKKLDEALIEQFSSGTMLLGGEKKPCLPATLHIRDEYCADVTITEGRYHQIKRMFLHCGYVVTKLHRLRFGPYDVKDIAEGKYVHLPLKI